MAQLYNSTRNSLLAGDVIAAHTLMSRLRGLLGQSSWPAHQSLWIKPCNSVHTFFMQFAIDVIFVDRDLRVQSIYRNLRPWKVTALQWRAHSVFEFAAGSLSEESVFRGDQLHVRP